MSLSAVLEALIIAVPIAIGLGVVVADVIRREPPADDPDPARAGTSADDR